MRARFIRYVTAVLVIAICGWTAGQGIGLVRFQYALDDVAAARRGADALDGWTATRGLASLALDAQLRALVDGGEADTAEKREALLVHLLSLKPGASRGWLSLASVRNVLAQPPDRIDAAFIMSGLTGPSEGDLMAERSLFGVLVWEKSSVEVHARTMSDICGLTVFDPWKFRLIMTTKSDAVRAEIRFRLEMNGCSPSIIKTIGP